MNTRSLPVGGTRVGSANATPARVVPQAGQVPENGSECPQNIA